MSAGAATELLGACVLRATPAADSGEPLTAARALALQLTRGWPAEALAAAQRAGVSELLHLGASYEARARVAIAARERCA